MFRYDQVTPLYSPTVHCSPTVIILHGFLKFLKLLTRSEVKIFQNIQHETIKFELDGWLSLATSQNTLSRILYFKLIQVQNIFIRWTHSLICLDLRNVSATQQCFYDCKSAYCLLGLMYSRVKIIYKLTSLPQRNLIDYKLTSKFIRKTRRII